MNFTCWGGNEPPISSSYTEREQTPAAEMEETKDVLDKRHKLKTCTDKQTWLHFPSGHTSSHSSSTWEPIHHTFTKRLHSFFQRHILFIFNSCLVIILSFLSMFFLSIAYFIFYAILAFFQRWIALHFLLRQTNSPGASAMIHLILSDLKFIFEYIPSGPQNHTFSSFH